MIDQATIARLRAEYRSFLDNGDSCDLMTEVALHLPALLDAAEQGMRDTERLGSIEAWVQRHRLDKCLGIFWDDDDGVFLAEVEHGRNGMALGSLPMVAKTVREAIDEVFDVARAEKEEHAET